MPKGPHGEKRPADANQLAKMIVGIASGDEANVPAKDKGAVALGRKGGQVRARKLTPSERSRIAREAANQRWRKARPEPETSE